jgi:hypothetical protein
VSAVKELHSNLQQLAQAEEKVFQYGTLIGNVDHIHDEYEPQDQIEDLYISALVKAEIFAENIVNLIAPDIEDDDRYWHAIVNVRFYIQDNERHQISLDGLQEAVEEAL